MPTLIERYEALPDRREYGADADTVRFLADVLREDFDPMDELQASQVRELLARIDAEYGRTA